MVNYVMKAREATVKFTASNIAPPAGASLDTDTALTAAGANAVMKNITFVVPQLAIDKIDLLGEASNFQNMEIDEKSVGMGSVSGTLILDGAAEPIALTMIAGGGTAIGGTHTRYQLGSSETAKKRVMVGGILLYLYNGSQVVNVLLDNAYVTKLGDIKVTGADGHWEIDFEAMCLAKDYYVEFKN